MRFDATGGNPGYLLGTTEPAEQVALQDHIRPGTVAYAIGANIGFHAVLAARLTGPAGRVIAFEPSPVSAESARRNAALNDFGHVEIVEVAVGNREGPVFLRQDGRSAWNAVTNEVTHDGVAVQQIRIDDWRSRHGSPPADFVLIDVEGAEIDVLRGMNSMITEAQPLILCEVHWLGPAFTDYVKQVLEPLGYTLRGLEGPAIKTCDRWHAVLKPSGWAPE